MFWPHSGRPAVAGRTDTGVHASGQVVSVEAADGGPEIGARAGGAQRAPAARRRRARLHARRPRGSTRASRRSPGATSTACCARARPRRCARRAPGTGRARSRRSCSRHAPTRCSASTTSAPSRRRRPSTRSSAAACSQPRGSCSGDELVFRIEADSFLRHMVRTLVGTMLQTAGGERPPEAFASLLAGRAARRGRRDGAAARALPRRRAVLSARRPGALASVRQHKLNAARSTIQSAGRRWPGDSPQMPPQER